MLAAEPAGSLIAAALISAQTGGGQRTACPPAPMYARAAHSDVTTMRNVRASL